jgi:hypothetical protein
MKTANNMKTIIITSLISALISFSICTSITLVIRTNKIKTWELYYDYSFTQHVKDLKYVDKCVNKDLGSLCDCARFFPIIKHSFRCNDIHH